jgi:PIN domain nuclease of toxin-antitoxin system
MPVLLLDTCAVIFIAENQTITPSARQQVRAASLAGGVLVSPISAWEIGLLAAKGQLTFLLHPNAWFRSFMSNPGVRLTPLTPEIAIESSYLPQLLHSDPADRMLIATARALQIPIMTRDRRILGYAQAGLVGAIVC